MASQGGHKEVVAFLIQKGIDINQTDEYGENACNLKLFKIKQFNDDNHFKNHSQHHHDLNDTILNLFFVEIKIS